MKKPNIYEELARSNKADILIAWCAERGVTAAILEVATAQEWRDMAVHAGVKPPGPQTRKLVIRRLRVKEDL